ncbi:MAG: hypothetical protein KF900_05815 [Bacteroidetes bacterium]|nr:hypothetical protein [Bacteroidota bacterium]
MKNELLKATHGSDKTQLSLGEIKIPCYVLSDTTRVFSGRGIQRALGSNATSGTWLTKFINDSPITKHLKTGVLEQLNNPIKFQRPQAGGSQSSTYGYEVTILIDICDSILEANKTGDKIDIEIVNNAQSIIRSVAKVGIIALVDEVTGYQYDRERFELQKILQAYISDEILKWQLTFTDDFYKEIYRLWGLPFIPKYIKTKPSFIGKLTSKYIYDQMPKGVVQKIKEKTGKTESGNWKYKWHQSLTPEIGKEHLKKQIIEVTTLMSISQSKEQFQSLFEKKYQSRVQLELEFNEEIKEPDLSQFNKRLKTALNYNPKNKEPN